MTGRLAAPSDLSPEQHVLYEAITTGARTSGVQHFDITDAHGNLQGPFGLMLHIPRVGRPLQDLGSALRFQTSLTDREREIAILTVARITDCHFERHAHNAVGAAVGLSSEELDALASGTFAGADSREEAVTQFAAVLADTAVVRPEDLFEELPDEVALEVVAVVGYYRLLAQMMGLYDVGVPTNREQQREDLT